ncbi:hypothetical protein O9H85_19300 [Paenibacillus filicis]|uniref:DNA topology modulation protein FlaR n=1 Tax=Paenibacillus gyeongsangnamensis TaxID=3388067 RepID=A0ABT4QCF9_9BACL|nr:hypothetical protein [Paenibacillus filicis]MCZ8514529.1 hypothetical protein [Paenibacillus filicis]
MTSLMPATAGSIKSCTVKEDELIKIRIIGSCGSGKSYIARAISGRYGIPCYELDNLVWDRQYESKKFPAEVRDAMLLKAMDQPSWVIEGVHYKWGTESFARADYIFVLQPNRLVRDFRVIKRFFLTCAGFEVRNYTQTFGGLLKMMFRWNYNYDRKDIHRVLELTGPYSEKRRIVRQNTDIFRHLPAPDRRTSGKSGE